jgi:regulatory protein
VIERETISSVDTSSTHEQDVINAARNLALRQLSHSPKTRAQLQQALLKKGVPSEGVEEVLDRLTEIGLIDDLAYAHLFVRSRCAGKRISRSSLMRELRAKGVAEDFARTAVDEISDEDEYLLARVAAEKKLRSMRGLDRDVVVRRVISLLARKGYSSAVTAKVLGSLEIDTDNLTQGDYYLAE